MGRRDRRERFFRRAKGSPCDDYWHTLRLGLPLALLVLLVLSAVFGPS